VWAYIGGKVIHINGGDSMTIIDVNTKTAKAHSKNPPHRDRNVQEMSPFVTKYTLSASVVKILPQIWLVFETVLAQSFLDHVCIGSSPSLEPVPDGQEGVV